MKNIKYTALAKNLSQGALNMTIKSVFPVTSSMVRIIFDSNAEVNHKNLDKALEIAFDNQASLVSGSIQNLSSENSLTKRYSAFVQGSRKIYSYSKETVDKLGLSLVTANVFSDGQENIWHLTNDDNEQYLVQQTEDDLAAILKARKGVHACTASIPSQPYKNVFSMVMLESGQKAFGYLASDESSIYLVQSKSISEIQPVQIMETAICDSDPILKQTANVPVEEYVKYIRTLYNHNPEFRDAYIENLRNVVLDDNYALTQMAGLDERVGGEPMREVSSYITVIARDSVSRKNYELNPAHSDLHIASPNADIRTWSIGDTIKWSYKGQEYTGKILEIR